MGKKKLKVEEMWRQHWAGEMVPTEHQWEKMLPLNQEDLSLVSSDSE